jgi:hypothetical protein
MMNQNSSRPGGSQPETAQSEPRQESRPNRSDSIYPRGRGPGEFGTHGGPKKHPGNRRPPGSAPGVVLGDDEE